MSKYTRVKYLKISTHKLESLLRADAQHAIRLFLCPEPTYIEDLFHQGNYDLAMDEVYPDGCPEIILEALFERENNPDTKAKHCPSMSPSDILLLINEDKVAYWMCAAVGFKLLPNLTQDQVFEPFVFQKKD